MNVMIQKGDDNMSYKIINVSYKKIALFHHRGKNRLYRKAKKGGKA